MAFGLAAIVVGFVMENWADRRARDDDFDGYKGNGVAYVVLIAWAGFLACAAALISYRRGD